MRERDYGESEHNFDLKNALFQEMKRLGPSMVSNRLNSRPPIDQDLVNEGIITSYDFVEEQDPKTGLFPSELAKCRELWDACSYISFEERILLLPAMAFSLYGHQEEWRNSGRPYSEHVFDVAKEAAEYRPFWWAVSGGLNHDLHEDSRKFGHPVSPDEVRNRYAQLNQAKEGADISRIMQAMTKFGKEPAIGRIKEKARTLIFRQRPMPADIRTVMRLYDTLLEMEGTDLGDEIVILLKLIDRKKNLETRQYLKREKRQRMARETLQIYVPMAEAFHLHKLRDELALLALEELYPETVERLKDSQIYLENIYQSLLRDGIGEYISQKFKSFTPISFWYDQAVPKVTFTVSSIYDLYKAETREENSLPHLKLQILLPELPGREETDNEWNARAMNCYQVLLPLADSIPRLLDDLPTIVQETALIPGKYLHFTFTNSEIDFRTTFLSVRQRISDHASLLDLFSYRDEPDIGQMSDWEELAAKNLQNVRERYSEARKQGNLQAFFESIAEEKRIFDEKGNPQQFPPNASLLDVISVLYGEDAFFVKSVRVKDLSGHVRTVQGEDLFQTLHEGEQIIGIKRVRQEQTEPVWLDNLFMESIQEMHIKRLESLAERDEEYKRKLRIRGNGVLQEKLRKAWRNHLGREPQADTAEMHLQIPARYVRYVFEHQYKDEDEFNYRLGLNQVEEPISNEVVDALVKYREGVVYLEVEIPDVEGAAGQFLDILTKEEVNLIRVVGQIIPGQGGEAKAWFHESELGELPEERKRKFRQIIGKLTSSGFIKKSD